MKKALLLICFVPLLSAQTAVLRVVRASGEGVVSIRPDQAKVNVGVVTTASTAAEASTQNATQVDAVIKALTNALGTSAPIKTISYSIVPNYRNQSGQPQQIVGYTANNTLEVTIADLSSVGKVVDTASRTGGANQISSLRFLLANSEPAKQQALAAAAKVARARVDAIASGLGARTGAVLAAQEGSTVTPVATNARLGVEAAATPTPIETGTLEVRATVALEVELLQ